MRNRLAVAAIAGSIAMLGVAAGWVRQVGAAAVRVERDLPYVERGGHRQQLDLYLPEARGFATILLVHGGSLTSGDRDEPPLPDVARALCSAGIAVASTSYRLSSDAAWPAQPRDVAASLAWVARHIAVRGGDPHRIVLLGHSSGARLVALVATDSSFLAAQGMSPRDVRGCVAMGTIFRDVEFETELAHATPAQVAHAFANDPGLRPFGDVAAYRNAWPAAHVHPGIPPMLVLVAEAEKEHPPCLSTGREFATAAARCGVAVAVEVLPDRTHQSALDKMASPGDPTLQRILHFVATGR